MKVDEVAQPLSGRAVLVTRPLQQAHNLVRLIVEAGGEAVQFPALSIEPATELMRVKEILSGVHSFDLAIFVSPTAVDQGFALLQDKWPPSVRVAALGEGTAAALRQQGVRSVIVPSLGADSESLLATAQLKRLRGKRVLIVRGEGGRELLAEQLRSRGAEVTYAECYRRARPRADCGSLIARWEQGGLDAVTVMSAATLDNLWAMLGSRGQRLLSATPLFVPHPSVAEHAGRLGLTEVEVTSAGDQGVLRALARWFSERSP